MWLQRQVEELTSVSKTIITETGRSRTITKKRKQERLRISEKLLSCKCQ